jgi:hypothetical protein
MKMRFLCSIAVIAILFLPFEIFGQQEKPEGSGPYLKVTYLENNSGKIQVFDQNGQPADEISYDTRFSKGWTVTTERGDRVELQLIPNKSIFKISDKTNFTVEDLQSDSGGTNVFKVVLGKARMIASKSTGQEYAVKGYSTTCGVRGTDFGVVIDPMVNETAFVLDGVIDFTNEAGQTIQVAKGMMADAMATVFESVEIPADFKAEIEKTLGFEGVNPEDVQGYTPAVTPSPEQPAAERPSAQAKPPAAPAGTQPGPLDGALGWLRDILGMEVGSVTISGATWSKVVLSPSFTLGDFKLGLYLPIIYQGDMFNPQYYYRPAGNDEWNFGTGGTTFDWADMFTDLILKIKYMEWGTQRDPFFFKVGNLEDITIGHGLIMRNFANDVDFPAVRAIGLNLGIDFGFLGFESMVDNAADIQIVGGRIYVRPFGDFRAAFGLSLVSDLSPAADLMLSGTSITTAVGNPIFFNPGIDIDLPFIESDALSLIGFADVACMVPYFRTAVPAGLFGPASIPVGFAWDAIWDPAATMPLKNYGFSTGVLGNVLIIDYRLEFRYFTGSFMPQFYNTGYMRTRGVYVLQQLALLCQPTTASLAVTQMGIYGEGGFTLDKIMNLTLGYFWPWQVSSTGAFQSSDYDHFIATLTIEKGVIPLVNVWGSVSYERTMFMPTILNGQSMGLTLFDANTVATAKVGYTITPNLDILLIYTATAHRDENGNLVYPTSGSGAFLPQLDTVLSIETDVHF